MSRWEHLKCDYCGLVKKERDAVNWIGTAVLGHDMRTIGDRQIEGRCFCCVDHCVKWLSGEPLPRGLCRMSREEMFVDKAGKFEIPDFMGAATTFSITDLYPGKEVVIRCHDGAVPIVKKRGNVVAVLCPLPKGGAV